MMHMPWVLAVLIVFLLLVAAGVFVAVRTLASHDDSRDHPRPARRQ